MSEKNTKTRQALRGSEESDRRFREQLSNLPTIINEISKTDSLDELCRQAVERGRKELGFDRLSIMLLDEGGLHTLSTFGTDESGKTRDERGIRLPLRDNIKQLFEAEGSVRFHREHNYQLRNDNEEIIGEGDHASAGLWDGENMIGYVNSDNLISKRRITDQQCELLSLYAASLGHLVSRLRATEALRESEQRFRNMFMASPMGMFVYQLEADGRLVMLDSNSAADRILGIDSKKLHGQSIEEAFPPLAESEIPHRYRRAAAQGESWHTQEFAYEDEKVKGTYEIYAFQTSPGQMAVMFFDVTERKQAEEQLKRYREHLEELVEQRTEELHDSQEQLRRSECLASIGTLAAGIAHEINNPVGQVLLAAQAAQAAHAAGTDSKRLEKPLADIVNYANRCKNIVQNIQRFARKETSDKIPCDLNHITRQAGELMQEYARKRNCEISYALAENLPKISLNKIGIEQVLVNLIKNAIEARARSVAIQTRCNNEKIRLIVEDNGEGIPDQVKKRLFDPFYTTRQSLGGTGLGLSLVHGIIREHGGNIDVQGEPGQGTTFTITLPKTADETEEAT